MLEVKNISHQYPNEEKSAIRPISFSVPTGEILCVVGRSGSGKTTLLKLISGLLDSGSGSINLDNNKILGPIDTLIPGHKDIKLVEQDYNLMPYTKVYENIQDHILYLSQKQRNILIEKWSAFLDIENIKEKKAKDLSGGQKQRVAIAKAMAPNPKVILLDEPFSNLDMISKTNLLVDLKSFLKEQQTTAIIVLHQPEEALEIADRILVLEEGKLQQIDSPDTIYNRPRHINTAQLFGYTNVLSKQQAELFLSTNTFHKAQSKVIFRPHQLSLKDLSLPYEIVERVFKGNYYLLKVKIKRTVLWIKE